MMSPKSAGLAKKWGYANVKVYVQGIPKWKKTGHRTEPSLEYVRDGNIVIADLRSPEAVRAGHIPRAYGFPAKDYEWAEYALPLSKSAPVIIYSDNDDETDMAVKATRKWGYKKVVGFYGALEEWKAKGYPLKTGPAGFADVDNVIPYEREIGPGQISIEDFKKALKADMIRVIDARTQTDYEGGHFPGSINIPLDEMKSRIREIPREKFIVLHCQTGARGEIAYNILKKEGFAVKYLLAECVCEPSGEYEIW